MRHPILRAAIAATLLAVVAFHPAKPVRIEARLSSATEIVR